MYHILLNNIQKVCVGDSQKWLLNEFLAVEILQTVLPVKTCFLSTKSKLVNMMRHVEHSFVIQ